MGMVDVAAVVGGVVVAVTVAALSGAQENHAVEKIHWELVDD